MNAPSRFVLHLALAGVAGYAGAAYHLQTYPRAAQQHLTGSMIHTASASVVPGTATPAAQAAARATGSSSRAAAARGSASVLSVYCAMAKPGGPGTVAIASGVVVDRDGLVVTTSEVAAQAGDLFVGLADGTQRPARRIAADRGAGLALLKVDGGGLEPIEMAGRDSVAVGDSVLALGDALGLGTTVTQGVVSAIRSARLEGTTATDFIQTDATIHPGNFGGALVDDAGRLVGITVGKVGDDDGQGLAFAVPADRVAQVMTRLRHAAHGPQARPAAPPERGRFTEVAYRKTPPAWTR